MGYITFLIITYVRFYIKYKVIKNKVIKEIFKDNLYITG